MKSKSLQYEAVNHFNHAVIVNSDVRDEDCLPWLKCHPKLQDNQQLEEKSIEYFVTISISKLNAYDEIFKDWLNYGVIE